MEAASVEGANLSCMTVLIHFTYGKVDSRGQSNQSMRPICYPQLHTKLIFLLMDTTPTSQPKATISLINDKELYQQKYKT